MSAGRSVIPPSGDLSAELARSEVWRSRSLLRAVLLGNFAIDAALVLAIVAWCST
jgi:hypothetical protein